VVTKSPRNEILNEQVFPNHSRQIKGADAGKRDASLSGDDDRCRVKIIRYQAMPSFILFRSAQRIVTQEDDSLIMEPPPVEEAADVGVKADDLDIRVRDA